MADFTELFERVNVASGPSRDLDRDLARALGWPVVTDHYAVDQEGLAYGGVPLWSTSIDDGLALVRKALPGWFWRCGRVPHQHWTGSRYVHGWAHLSRADASNCDATDEATGWCETVPLAILSALLTALQKRRNMPE
jgi:hypothetical protein